MHRPVVVRDAVPLGSAGQIRLLDGIENRLGEGQPIPGLADVLGRAGVGFVVVRNDLRSTAAGSPQPRSSAHWSGRGYLGPPSSGRRGPSEESADHFVDYRTVLSRPALEVFAVPHPRLRRWFLVAALVTANGGPEDPLLRLAEAQAGQSTLLGSDAAALAQAQTTAGTALAARSWLTDGLRRREVSFAVSNRTSGLLTPDDPGRSTRRVIDGGRQVGRTDGAALGRGRVRHGVELCLDATATLRLSPAYTPSAAVDGDPANTVGERALWRGRGEWLRVDFTEPTSVSGLAATFSGAHRSPLARRSWPWRPSRGSITADVIAGVGPAALPCPA